MPEEVEGEAVGVEELHQILADPKSVLVHRVFAQCWANQEGFPHSTEKARFLHSKGQSRKKDQQRL